MWQLFTPRRHLHTSHTSIPQPYHTHTSWTPRADQSMDTVWTVSEGQFDICKTRGLLAMSVRLYIVILACKTRVS